MGGEGEGVRRAALEDRVLMGRETSNREWGQWPERSDDTTEYLFFSFFPPAIVGYLLWHVSAASIALSSRVTFVAPQRVGVTCTITMP